MSWLKRILTGRKEAASNASPAPWNFRLNDDASYNANTDILEGVQFIATLHVSTPYAVLLHHGEVFVGPPSKAPQYGNQSEGMWVPKIKSLQSLGIDRPELPPAEHATDIGPKRPDAYLPFLIDFRQIFESADDDGAKIEKLRILSRRTLEFSSFWKQLESAYEDFPRNIFYNSFLKLPGVGRKTARALYEAGFRSVEQIQNTEQSQLQKVRGVGPGLAKKITANSNQMAHQ